MQYILPDQCILRPEADRHVTGLSQTWMRQACCWTTCLEGGSPGALVCPTTGTGRRSAASRRGGAGSGAAGSAASCSMRSTFWTATCSARTSRTWCRRCGPERAQVGSLPTEQQTRQSSAHPHHVLSHVLRAELPLTCCQEEHRHRCLHPARVAEHVTQPPTAWRTRAHGAPAAARARAARAPAWRTRAARCTATRWPRWRRAGRARPPTPTRDTRPAARLLPLRGSARARCASRAATAGGECGGGARDTGSGCRRAPGRAREPRAPLLSGPA